MEMLLRLFRLLLGQVATHMLAAGLQYKVERGGVHTDGW